MGQLVKQEMQAHQAEMVSLVQMVHLDNQELQVNQASKGNQDQLDPQAKWARKAVMALQERRAYKGQQVSLDRPVSLVP